MAADRISDCFLRRRPTRREIALDERDAASLQHACHTLRWLIAKTERGWSHAAVDPAECRDSAARFQALYYEAREQLKTARIATVAVTEADASLLRRFIVLIEAVELGAFAELVSELRAIAGLIEPANGQPSPRGRRSPLAES